MGGYEWRLEVKYSPDQPRVPAGSPGGGRWTSGGGGANPKAVAARIRAEAERREPDVTEAFTSAMATGGARPFGLEFRLKSEGSLARKLASEAEENGTSPDQVEIRDSIRFTAILDEQDYGPGVLRVHRALEEKGWTPYDHQLKNYWKPGDAYDGYNCVFTDATGFLVELQFHTPHSIDVKENGAHPLYERARILPPGPERTSLIDQMTTLWASVARPKGWQSLPGVMK